MLDVSKTKSKETKRRSYDYRSQKGMKAKIHFSFGEEPPRSVCARVGGPRKDSR